MNLTSFGQIFEAWNMFLDLYPNRILSALKSEAAAVCYIQKSVLFQCRQACTHTQGQGTLTIRGLVNVFYPTEGSNCNTEVIKWLNHIEV